MKQIWGRRQGTVSAGPRWRMDARIRLAEADTVEPGRRAPHSQFPDFDTKSRFITPNFVT